MDGIDLTGLSNEALAAALNFHSAVKRTTPELYDEQVMARHQELIAERTRRLKLDQELPDGIYVSKAWAHKPEQSILWIHANQRWTSWGAGKGDTRTPLEFYGMGWQNHIVRLIAEPGPLTAD